jgi:hypothetical protein
MHRHQPGSAHLIEGSFNQEFPFWHPERLRLYSRGRLKTNPSAIFSDTDEKRGLPAGR